VSLAVYAAKSLKKAVKLEYYPAQLVRKNPSKQFALIRGGG
jgi:hypothetical protein